MTQEEAKKKYLEYLEGHIGNVKEAFNLLCSLDIPFINENKDKLQTIIDNHDQSKYDEPEWSAYLHHFYPTCDEDSLKTEEFEEACRHHINQNPHHWDFWTTEGELREDIDELEYKLYTVERLCDHMAMSIQNNNKPADWYFANKESIKMPSYGYDLYEELLNALPDDYDLSFHGTRTDGKPERETITEDAIDDYIKDLNIDETSIVNNYDTQISNHYKYIRLVGRKINRAKYDNERIQLKRKQDFYKAVYKKLKELKSNLKEELGLNDKVVLKLGKRVKRSKTSNAIEIDTQMTNHDKQLKESSSIIYGYRSISKNEFFKLLDGETIKGTFDNSQEKQTTSNAANVVAFYKDKYRWKDARHVFFIKCKFNESDLVDTGVGTYYASKDFAKTKVWSGRRGNTEYQLDEFYVSEYNLDNVVAFDYEALSLFNSDYQKRFTDSLTQKGIPSLNESVKLERYYVDKPISDNKCGTFFVEKGKGLADHGDKKVSAVLNDEAKIFEGTSSHDYIYNNGLENEEYQGIEEFSNGAYHTVKEYVEADENGDYSKFVDNNPNAKFYATQYAAWMELKRNYDGAFWSEEDDLDGPQYQIWNNSVIEIVEDLKENMTNKEQLIKLVKEADSEGLWELNYWFTNAGYYQEDKRRSKKAFIISCIENNYTDEPSSTYQKSQNKELENLVCNALRKDGEEYLKKTTLKEMKLSQIKQKSKNQDPERINRSKKVKTTYLGMSKFGILNFKTTSQSRNGHHYQTVEFKDMTPFEEIIKTGTKIMPADVKKQLQEQDVNVWCTDESWAYWAWAHQAYKNDFLYIDDRIPNLKKAIQAPKVNNVRLNGGACKHILSVIDYCTRPFVLLAISDDMNKYLAGTQDDKMQKQTVATQNQYDMVANWDWSDIEELTGLSRIQIISDISKTLQVVPKASQGDIITDIVGEALPQEDQGMKRAVVDQIEELIKEDK